jgi:hypothetical protein
MTRLFYDDGPGVLPSVIGEQAVGDCSHFGMRGVIFLLFDWFGLSDVT